MGNKDFNWRLAQPWKYKYQHIIFNARRHFTIMANFFMQEVLVTFWLHQDYFVATWRLTILSWKKTFWIIGIINVIIMFSIKYRCEDIQSTSIYSVEFHAYGWWQISMENTKYGLMGFRSQTLASNVVCVHDCTVLFCWSFFSH